MYGASPDELYKAFRKHLNDLLHGTITDASLGQVNSSVGTMLQFFQHKSPIAVPVGRYYLYLGQTLAARQGKNKQYRLRTVAYAYRICQGPDRDNNWLIRWEYNSREIQSDALHPRNHCHLSTSVEFGGRKLDLAKMHIASGWVTIEEVIRFLIHELKVKPKHKQWDKRLRESEEKFREWTARDI